MLKKGMKSGQRRTFKLTITKRWLISSVLSIAIVFLIIDIVGAYIVKNYYYSSINQQIATKANIVLNSLQYYEDDTNTNFSAQIRSMVENYEDKETVELQAINNKGEIVISSSGFAPVGTIEMPDYYEAVSTNDISYYIGKLATKEKVMTATVPAPEEAAGFSALRLLVSLENADRQTMLVSLFIVGISVGILALIVISGQFFIRSIVSPVRQIGKTARQIAAGDFSARIEQSYRINDEMSELCSVINYMADELSNAEKMKNDFISSISHELRTPLTAIKGWAETLRGIEDQDTVKKGMRVISSESDRLSALVEELLDFSRIQNGKFTLVLSNMDILAELEDAILIYQEGARRAEIALHYNAPENLPVFFGDKNRLRQVFINIIDNAIKYSDAGGNVWITASADKDNIKITVRDSGCGISEQDLPNVKTKFYKANHTKRGSGIGLAVAEEIVTMHDGQLFISSEENVGTTVDIVLPIKEKAADSDKVEIKSIEQGEE